ncbi:MAG: hypothetical protein J5601_06755 [Elusimicrobiaceae bacterium]|nr:hypothetical protein [Elusimicrobiaceae bacterium]
MIITCGLIKGRHHLPGDVEDFVFLSDIPQKHIRNAFYLDRICADFLDRHPDVDKICVYVTGFTPAMLALVKACVERGLHLVAMNYDRETKKFWSQEVM